MHHFMSTKFKKIIFAGFVLIFSHIIFFFIGSSIRQEQQPGGGHPILSHIHNIETMAEYFTADSLEINEKDKSAAQTIGLVLDRTIHASGIGSNSKRRLATLYSKLNEKLSGD